MNTLTKWDHKLGSAALGFQFMSTGLYALTDTNTRFFAMLTAHGLQGIVGWSMLLSGLMTFYGAMRPIRCLRHLGQFGMFTVSVVLTTSFLMIGYFPPVVTLSIIGGVFSFGIWVRDGFHGMTVRQAKNGHLVERG